MITSIYNEPIDFGVSTPKVNLPINEWLGIKAEEGQANSWQAAYERNVDRALDLFPSWFGQRPRISKEDANKMYGVPGFLEFNEDVFEDDAHYKHLTAIRELKQKEILEGAKSQSGVWRWTSGIGANIAGQMFNSRLFLNIDFGIGTFPVTGVSSKTAAIARAAKYDVKSAAALAAAEKTGETTAASLLAKYGETIGFRKIVEQGGLFGLEAEKLGVFGGAKMIPLTESVLNGTSTIAIGELNTFFDAVYRNDETHYLQNVAVGSAAVVPFHFVMKGVVKSLSKTAEIFNVVTKESSDLATAKASARAITGDDSINPTSHITADEGVIAEKAKAQKVEADLAAARESRVVIRQTGESPTVGPNELLYLVQSEAARQSGKPEGTLLQSLLDEFRKGRRDLTLFEKMAAAMDRSYDPFAVHPQDIFFVEKVFGGEQAAHIARANELIGRLPNEINILQNALAKLSRMINEFADSPQIAQIQKAIEEVNAQRSVIEKQRNQLLSDKKKFPIYAKEIDAKIKALDPEYAALKEKAKRLKGERAKAQAENSARIDQLKKNHDSLTAELYAHREARTKYGPKTEAPKQLYPRELMLQAREQVAKRNAQLSERTNTIVVNGKTIQLNPKLTDVAQKLAATRDEMFRIGKLIEDAFEKGEYEPRMVEWAKRLRDLERGERSLYNRYNELVAELNVAKARENLEPLKQKKAELQKKLDAAKEAENNELITTIKKQIAELEIEAEPLKRAIQEQKDLASIVKIEDEINTLQVLIEELKAKEQQARIDKNSNLELELANKRDVAEKQLEKLVEQLDSKEKVKSRPLNADEVSNHRAKRRADIEETVRDEREKAVKIAIESDDPAFSAKQEIKEAQQTASQLEKQRETPQSKEYRAASADQEKITSIEKRESDEFVSAINDDIKKLREFATPEPGTQQTSAQKKAQLRAEQFEAILKDAESQISKEIDQINTDHDGVVAMLDCMSKTGN